MTTRPIFGSHDLMVSYTLGGDDETSLAPTVECKRCVCYVEGGITLECFGTPTLKASFPLPINP